MYFAVFLKSFALKMKKIQVDMKVPTLSHIKIKFKKNPSQIENHCSIVLSQICLSECDNFSLKIPLIFSECDDMETYSLTLLSAFGC